MSTKKKAVILGAGPAGLTAGLELLRTEKFAVTVVERDKIAGGLSRTTEFKKCRFDIGPHHFVTESEKVLRWWQQIMPNDFPKLKRFTRIYYLKHYFHYPLEPLNVIRGLNIIECLRSVGSYIWIRIFPIKEVRSFEDWVTNKFGRRLFFHFFKTYTEKVWGVECNKISADWSAERIRGFSLSKAIFYAFFGRWFKKNQPRTLSNVFYYPSHGAGALWEKVGENIALYDEGRIVLNTEVVSIEHDSDRIKAVLTRSTRAVSMRAGASVALKRYEADYFLSSMPLRGLIMALDPLPSPEVIAAAKALRYRGLITVNLVIKRTHVCPDHWLYIHEKEVRVGRIGNMNNFSPLMVDNAAKHTALSLEYFAFANEPLWLKSDYELVECAKRELDKIGLVKAAAVLDGMVIRVADAYPVYDEHYKEHLGTVMAYVNRFSNLQLMGRNGLHQYNNMDLAMLSAMTAVEQIMNSENRQPREKAVQTNSVFLS